MVSSYFDQQKIGDEIYYFPPAIQANRTLIHQVHILPPYDEYIMGYKNREAIFVTLNKITPVPKLLLIIPSYTRDRLWVRGIEQYQPTPSNSPAIFSLRLIKNNWLR